MVHLTGKRAETWPQTKSKVGHPQHGSGLDVTGVSDGVIVFQPSQDRIHFLNHSAGFIFELCTGSNTTAEIGEAVRVAFDLPEEPTAEIEQCLVRLHDLGLLR
jgi:hypothetical protein